MKLLLPVILLIFSIISCIYSQSQSSSSSTDSSSTFKYVKIETYPNGNGECTGELISADYVSTGICAFGGLSRLVCLEDGKIENVIYTGEDCTGEIDKIFHVTPNNCTNGVQHSCVEEMTIPDNSYQTYTANRVCPHTDPDWKSKLVQVSYILTEICMNNSQGANMITCNSTSGIPMEYIFNSTDSCSTNKNNWTGYEYLVLPECSYRNPSFSNCGPPINF